MNFGNETIAPFLILKDLFNNWKNLDEISMWKEIKLWSTMVALYSLCVVAMVVWRNKLISHIFLAKFMASLLASLGKLLSQFFTKDISRDYIVYWMTFRFIRSSMIAIEQLMTLILFLELYLAICKMERREYKLATLLKKIGLLSIVGIAYASLFSGLEIFHFKVSTRWIDDICLSALLAIPLIFCFVKVMMTLIENGKFKTDTLVKNHFIIHLMIMLFLIHIWKIISFSIIFYLENYKSMERNGKKCRGNITTDYVQLPCFFKTINLFLDSGFKQSYLSTQICSLAEALYIIVIMVLKQTYNCMRCCSSH